MGSAGGGHRKVQNTDGDSRKVRNTDGDSRKVRNTGGDRRKIQDIGERHRKTGSPGEERQKMFYTHRDLKKVQNTDLALEDTNPDTGEISGGSGRETFGWGFFCWCCLWESQAQSMP